MQPVRCIAGRYVVMSDANIDTDQIIPARFMGGTVREGLGARLFADRRRGSDGSLRTDFVLNAPAAAGAVILVAGDNFGCGSSREHAVWALLDYGLRAVVSTSFADVFRANALRNGLLAATVSARVLRALVAAGPIAETAVDLERCAIAVPGAAGAPFSIDRFARYCLLHGVDELDFLLRHGQAISAYEKGRTP